MKFLLLSDLHNEFTHGSFVPIKNPGVDLLILAGDILTAANGPLEFINHVASEFPEVIYVMGNHEHYHGNLDTTRRILQDYINTGNEGSSFKNVHLLENSMWRFPKDNGIRFFGTTLWTDMNKDNPGSRYRIEKDINDYRLIKKNDPERSAGVRKMRTGDTITLHYQAVSEIKRFLDLNREVNAPRKPCKVVIVTHMAPTHLSIHDKYRYDFDLNGAYVSDLSQLILDYPEIIIWCHGHVHNTFDYTIGSTRVITNPRGYPMNFHKTRITSKDDPWWNGLIWENSDYDVGKIFEI